MFNNLKKVVSQNKIATGVIASSVLAVQSQAAGNPLSYSTATGFTGTIDMKSYSTAITVVLGVVAIVIATSIGFKALKGAKNA